MPVERVKTIPLTGNGADSISAHKFATELLLDATSIFFPREHSELAASLFLNDPATWAQ